MWAAIELQEPLFLGDGFRGFTTEEFFDLHADPAREYEITGKDNDAP